MKIRTMTEADLGFVMDCIHHENWLGETEAVFRSFMGFDALGCLIGEVQDRPVGMCVATSYGTRGFLGALIVVEDQRGRGLGRQLLEQAIEYLKSRGAQSLYLDGDGPAVPLYQRIGFKIVEKSLRFVGTLPGSVDPTTWPMLAEDLDSVAALDRDAFGANRAFFLKARFQGHPGLCRTVIHKGQVAGFIMALPGTGVISVGPWLVGESLENPLSLLESLALATGDTPLRIGVLESNGVAVSVLRGLEGFKETEPSIRMVLGPDTGLGTHKTLFAVGAAAKG